MILLSIIGNVVDEPRFFEATAEKQAMISYRVLATPVTDPSPTQNGQYTNNRPLEVQVREFGKIAESRKTAIAKGAKLFLAGQLTPEAIRAERQVWGITIKDGQPVKDKRQTTVFNQMVPQVVQYLSPKPQGGGAVTEGTVPAAVTESIDAALLTGV